MRKTEENDNEAPNVHARGVKQIRLPSRRLQRLFGRRSRLLFAAGTVCRLVGDRMLRLLPRRLRSCLHALSFQRGDAARAEIRGRQPRQTPFLQYPSNLEKQNVY